MTTEDTNSGMADFFPGKRLQESRKQAGMTIEEVANELRLSSSQVQALEDDYYEDMPGMTYVRGYLRSYARLLNIDEQEIVPPLPAVEDRSTPTAPSGSFAPRPPRRQVRSSDRHVKVGTLIVLVATVAGLVTWWQSRENGIERAVSLGVRESKQAAQGTEHPSANTGVSGPARALVVDKDAPVLATRPVERMANGAASSAEVVSTQVDEQEEKAEPAEAAAAEQAAEAAVAAEATDAAGETEAPPSVSAVATAAPRPGPELRAAPEPAPEPQVKSKPKPEPPARAQTESKAKPKPKPRPAAAAASGRTKLVFAFDGTSWVDVRDANNERLLYQSMTEGRSVTVEGKPPFRIFLGNAKAVRIDYAGKPVNVAAYQDGLYARFTLGQDGQ